MMTKCVWAAKLMESYCKENQIIDETHSNNLVLSNSVNDLMKVARVIKRRLKVRKNILDNG